MSVGYLTLAAYLATLALKDGASIEMNNLNFWTFENGKFKVLRIYMDTYPFRQALQQALGGEK